jgi:hypothetical protein
VRLARRRNRRLLGPSTEPSRPAREAGEHWHGRVCVRHHRVWTDPDLGRRLFLSRYGRPFHELRVADRRIVLRARCAGRRALPRFPIGLYRLANAAFDERSLCSGGARLRTSQRRNRRLFAGFGLRPARGSLQAHHADERRARSDGWCMALRSRLGRAHGLPIPAPVPTDTRRGRSRGCHNGQVPHVRGDRRRRRPMRGSVSHVRHSRSPRRAIRPHLRRAPICMWTARERHGRVLGRARGVGASERFIHDALGRQLECLRDTFRSHDSLLGGQLLARQRGAHEPRRLAGRLG